MASKAVTELEFMNPSECDKVEMCKKSVLNVINISSYLFPSLALELYGILLFEAAAVADSLFAK